MGGLILLLVAPIAVAIAALVGAWKLVKAEDASTGGAFVRGLGVLALVLVALVGLGIGGCAGLFLFGGGLGNMH